MKLDWDCSFLRVPARKGEGRGLKPPSQIFHPLVLPPCLQSCHFRVIVVTRKLTPCSRLVFFIRSVTIFPVNEMQVK